MLSDQTGSFQEVGLIEYPRKGLWAIVFISTATKGEVDNRLKSVDQDTLSVFLPTTPNPTSGFLLFVPKQDVTVLSMSVEDAAKLVISAGLVAAEDHQAQLQGLADAEKDQENALQALFMPPEEKPKKGKGRKEDVP